MKRKEISVLDRHTEIGSISLTVKSATKRIIMPLIIFSGVASTLLLYRGIDEAMSFAFMAAGTCAALSIWSSQAIGLPLLPMLVLQNLIIYGVPILAGHEIVMAYPPRYIVEAGVEVLIFNMAIAISWSVAMRLIAPSPPVSYVLHEINKEGAAGWRRMGFVMIAGATVFQLLQGFNLTNAIYAILPSGGDSLINALLSVTTACGFFLVSMVVAKAETPVLEKILFWTLLAANALLSAASLLLAGAAAYLVSVAVGLFWSSGRIPWRYLAVAVFSLAFLNIGKTTLREHYWITDEAREANVPIPEMPGRYEEWVAVSYSAIFEGEGATVHGEAGAPPEKNQTLLDRLDNLQNLLFAIDAIDARHFKPLMGKTYSLIPPLLVPRIFWPDKPRSHEGQVLLNVYFGRQDLNSTFSTYIAWGLLPEAYGNFGPYAGSIVLGIALGFIFAWVENHTARKLLVSAEGFLSLSIFMNLMNSFEMVSSVLVTSTFQSCVVVVLATMPFVRKMRNPRPAGEAS